MMLISEDINNSEMKFILILPVDYKSWRQFIYLLFIIQQRVAKQNESSVLLRDP